MIWLWRCCPNILKGALLHNLGRFGRRFRGTSWGRKSYHTFDIEPFIYFFRRDWTTRPLWWTLTCRSAMGLFIPSTLFSELRTDPWLAIRAGVSVIRLPNCQEWRLGNLTISGYEPCESFVCLPVNQQTSFPEWDCPLIMSHGTLGTILLICLCISKQLSQILTLYNFI